jgi:hypothetical protein
LATAAQLNLPSGAAVDSGGNIFIADSANDRIRVASSLPAFSPSMIGPVSNLPTTTDPTQPLGVGVNLNTAYGATLRGTLKLTFFPTSANPIVDPAVQFSSGGQTASFTIPVGQTQGVFDAGNSNLIQFQTGTVAGTIAFTITLTVPGQTVASDVPAGTVAILDRAPVITAVKTQRVSTNELDISITGFSTSRQLSGATFVFLGTNIDATPIAVDITSTFTDWYQRPESAQYGSSFTLKVPFTVSGSALPSGSVSVTLTNRAGTTSPASSAAF